MLRTFKRGVHLDDKKISAGTAIKKFKIPKKLIVPLKQHLGKPNRPIVKQGDYVKGYQLLADTDDCMCAPIHSPTSGTVVAVGDEPHPNGGRCPSVVIEPDLKNLVLEREGFDPSRMDPSEIVDAVASGGVVGMGGAACPASLKLKGKPDIFILNGCECEPYITADHRLMLESAEDIISGLKILMKASGAKKGIIGIEDNKGDAIEIFKRLLNDKREKIVVRPVRTKYPQGAEKLLIYALTKRRVPAGGLPIDAGVVVNNVATAKAVHDAVVLGIPLISRIVTVTGDVKRPGNYNVLIGTSFRELIMDAGLTGNPRVVINGGPMMGVAVDTMDVPVIKSTSSILVLNDPERFKEPEKCIRCGRCVTHCPMGLSPTTIARYSESGQYGLCRESHAMDCFECGICSYVCPSKIPLTHRIRTAKMMIRKLGRPGRTAKGNQKNKETNEGNKDNKSNETDETGKSDKAAKRGKQSIDEVPEKSNKGKGAGTSGGH